jgi:hypothetical protein
VSVNLKTGISEIRSGQEGLKQEISAEIIDITEELKNGISAMETKLNAGQAEYEDRMTFTLYKHLKSVTAMVEQ